MSNILFFDTETTGLNPDTDSVIQIAAQYYQNGRKVSEFETKVAPYRKSTGLGALATNKTTPAQMLQYPNPQSACDQFVAYITSLPGFNKWNKIIPAAHNATFDIRFLQNFLTVHGYRGWEDIFSHRVVDTAPIARFLIDAGAIDSKSASLGTVAEALGIERDEEKQHEAMYDTELCAKLYYTMIELVKGNLNLEPRKHNWA